MREISGNVVCKHCKDVVKLDRITEHLKNVHSVEIPDMKEFNFGNEKFTDHFQLLFGGFKGGFQSI